MSNCIICHTKMGLLMKNPIFFDASALDGALCLVLRFNCIWSGPLGLCALDWDVSSVLLFIFF